VAAVEHATHEQISGALDLHRTLAEHHYKLMSDGSMINWRGHTFEQQINEQIEGWAGSSAASMPEANNYAGPDMSIFGQDFQIKGYEDFAGIDNTYGDPLVVADGAANIPEDALYVDFSQPFDPSILEGHDVIVAEGLTLAGAEDAWESAAGMAAGGVDLGDVGDAGFDMAIPGLGAAIRVAASGYRRRAALADPELRAEASGRVGRDAVYGLAGASSGGTMGVLLGGLVDVATLGLTMGMGTVIGGMIGAGAGGMAGGALASAEDQERIDGAARETREAIEQYGQALEIVQVETDEEWNRATSQADRSAADVQRRLDQSLARVGDKARTDLANAADMTEGEAVALLRWAFRVLQMLAAQETGRRARRRQKAWMQRLASVRRMPLDTEQILLLLIAVPGGQAVAQQWLWDRNQRRGVTISAASVVLERLVGHAIGERMSLQVTLQQRRRELRESAKDELEPYAVDVRACTKKVKRELAISARG
jgi:hypothetical protein